MVLLNMNYFFVARMMESVSNSSTAFSSLYQVYKQMEHSDLNMGISTMNYHYHLLYLLPSYFKLSGRKEISRPKCAPTG